MTEPLPQPPASPPPRVRWLRAVVFTTLVSLLGFVSMIFAQVGPRNYDVILLLVLVTGPLALLAWSFVRMRRASTDAAREEFRRCWTRVWLGALGTTLITFVLLSDWRGDIAAAVHWPALLLSAWTTLLMVVCWRLYRVLLNRKLWTRTAFVAACLATLVALAYGFENWRGRRVWERVRAEWAAKGSKFTYPEVLPPPVPDELNVAMHPMLKPALDYTLNAEGDAVWRDTNALARLNSLTALPHALRSLAEKAKLNWPTIASAGVQNRTNGVELVDFTQWQAFYRLDTNFAQLPASANPAADVLRYLERHQTNLALLDDALARPHCQFPVHLTNSDPGRILLPHLANVRMMTLLTALRVTAHLEVGRPTEALRDFERSLRLCRAMESEPFTMSYLVQVSIQAFTLGAVAHGCAKHQWEDAQLARIQELLRPVQPLKNLAFTLRAEVVGCGDWATQMKVNRAAAERLVTEMASATSWNDTPLLKTSPEFGRKLIRHAPSGWFLEMSAYEQRDLLEAASAVATAADRQQLDWQRLPASPTPPWFSNIWPFRLISEFQRTTLAKCARIQTNLDHARLAIALERHWLRHRAYPKRLDTLVLEFLDRIPHDLFDGQPMRYRREGEQGFVLWSVGFDGKDDNAGPLLTKPSGTTSVGEETGDLVWRYPQ